MHYDINNPDRYKILKIAVLTSGGDAPGMNAAVRAVAHMAFARHWEAVGIEAGYLCLTLV